MAAPATSLREVHCVRFSVAYIQKWRLFGGTSDVLFTFATNFHIKRGTAYRIPIVEEVLRGDDVALHKYSLATIQRLTGSLDGLYVLFRHSNLAPLLWLMDPRQRPWTDKLLLSIATLSLYGNRVPSTPQERYDEVVVLVPIGEKLPASTTLAMSPSEPRFPRPSVTSAVGAPAVSAEAAVPLLVGTEAAI